MRRCVRARTRAMCGRTCACACEIHSGKCAECACVRPFFGRAMCDRILHTFAHFLGQKVAFFLPFCSKNVHDRTSHAKNEPHARTSRTLFRMDFARTRTRATAHRTCACAHAPSQLIACKKYRLYEKKIFFNVGL